MQLDTNTPATEPVDPLFAVLILATPALAVVTVVAQLIHWIAR